MAEVAAKPSVQTTKTTAAVRPEGWMPFETLHREIDRLFEDFRPFSLPSLHRRSLMDFNMPDMASTWAVAPAFDVVEKEKAYEITAELPGMDEKGVEIGLSNGVLTISGEKKEEKEEKENGYYLSERRFGSFRRSFQLPEGTDPDKIDARFAKGVLSIVLPKTIEALKPDTKIAVKAA